MAGNPNDVVVGSAAVSMLGLCAILDCMEKSQQALRPAAISSLVSTGTGVMATLGGFGVFTKTVTASIATVVVATVGIGTLSCLGGCAVGCVCAACCCNKSNSDDLEVRRPLLQEMRK